MKRTLVVPFGLERGFEAAVFDAAGKRIPSCVAGEALTVRADRAGLYFVNITGISGGRNAVAKVVR
jgi:hypothetical protein